MRAMTILLVGALMIALGIAAFSLWQLQTTSKTNAAAITALTEKHTAALKVAEDKLSRATATLRDDDELVAQLEIDNANMKAGKRAQMPPPPQSARQKYIYDLQKENVDRRARKTIAAPVVRPPNYGYDYRNDR